ncbi:hypothetical protein Mgra_00008121 [Meloidogyne graminicola]|uniref:SPRY domain-containing protein n=1 Tax=Meloidogyne graminicola TaxID=189291 RepID=A0A8S9ZGI3_9BILA|nr:hypothetical protein Mgra_00008121 [Meloidogyne graminicola]
MTENTQDSHLDKENVLTDSQNIILEEKTEIASTASIHTDKDLISIDKGSDELALENKQLDTNKVFVQVINNWKYVNCFNTENSKECDNGIIEITNGTNIKYNKNENGINKIIQILAENRFNKPNENSECITYSIFYYEIQSQIEENGMLTFGLKDENSVIRLCLLNKLIYYYVNYKKYCLKIPSFSYENGDIIGCGLVYPPSIINKFPYVFFTKNGELIGKSIQLEENYEYLQPFVVLKLCNVETNFGNDLILKDFCYNISNHHIAEDFILINKEDEELPLELKQKNSKFIYVSNKWKLWISSKCCGYKCLHTFRPDTSNKFCEINDTNVNYICSKQYRYDKDVGIRAENVFNNPNENFEIFQYKTYSLFYYENKIKSEKNFWNYLNIGFGNYDCYIRISPTDKDICYSYNWHKLYNVYTKRKKIELPSFSYENGDIIGCGLVYPPPIINKFPYIFFTKNGELIDL